ncbi:24084b87-f557-4e60-a010-53a7d5f96ab3 [Thermothielavioides terrestris]|uniref:24084b87-f557-4e60-a010-53a7d5f96ab3 n=1 Tax=Thermothielavioides terrestris TaxID=2587410 RepID=A0A446BDN2_9PEZI|nr:24084b87-f557-4e60-a010-53a7d5f96ab3 [Thermothielavioides terrestris]
MYRTKHFRWKLAHTSGILAHLGLAVAASISYTYHIGQATGPIQWSYPAHQIWTSMSLNPCGSVMMGDLEGGYILDTAARRLSLASSLGMKTAGSKSLTAPLIWASIQTPLALFMAVLDAVKNYREGLDLLD